MRRSGSQQLKKLSIVVPVLNEEANLIALRQRLGKVQTDLALKGITVQYLVNNNASTDSTGIILEDWALDEENVEVVTFSHTVSFQTSIMRGMKRATGDCLVVLQSDLQDPPELIPDLVDEWLLGKNVVAAIAKNKHSSLFQNFMRRTFYRILTASSQRTMVAGFQDFYLLDKSVYSRVALRNDQFQFIRGTIAAEFGLDSVVPYTRSSRQAGKSKFSLLDKYDLAMDGLLVFSSKFIRNLAVAGMLTAAASFIALAVYLTYSIFGHDFGVPGWASLIAVVLFILGLVLAFFSIVFEFLSRILRLLIDR